MTKECTIIGGGLAGCEAAWQAAQRGIQVTLYEMRPQKPTGAHTTGDLAELICSNSLGSTLPDRASGMLKEELRHLNSLLLDIAVQTALPAGAALAVDRERFARQVTQTIEAHPNIRVLRAEAPSIPAGPCIIASGPLTSPALSAALTEFTGQDHLYFFDAIAPVIAFESINMNIAYRGSRFNTGEEAEGDYINCPFTQEEYERFVRALVEAKRIPLKSFEEQIETGVRAGKFFEGCLPVEIIASRGALSLAFGPMRPIGLRAPGVTKRAYAVLQLRRDNLAGTLYNMVGFQTNLLFPEQKRVFRMIPGLENAEFARYGQMHRNTFIASPAVLWPTLQSRQRPDLFFAGQITGVEGYLGNIATGALAGINTARQLLEQPLLEFPQASMLGALCHYITHADLHDFQPMKANFGILPELVPPAKMTKQERAARYVQRGAAIFNEYLKAHA